MHNEKPLILVEINGKRGTMMIDNGVLWEQIWLFGSPLVTELDLKPVEESSIGGAGESSPTDAYTSENLTLKFNIIFDYINNKIYIDPNKNFDIPFE